MTRGEDALSSEHIRAVTALPGPKRYSYFVKKSADRGSVWGLYDGGWATMRSEHNVAHMPVWPTADFAALCASGEWRTYKPSEVEVHVFLDQLLPQLRKDRTGVAVFVTPNDRGAVPSLDVLERDMRAELSRIE